MASQDDSTSKVFTPNGYRMYVLKSALPGLKTLSSQGVRARHGGRWDLHARVHVIRLRGALAGHELLTSLTIRPGAHGYRTSRIPWHVLAQTALYQCAFDTC